MHYIKSHYKKEAYIMTDRKRMIKKTVYITILSVGMAMLMGCSKNNENMKENNSTNNANNSNVMKVDSSTNNADSDNISAKTTVTLQEENEDIVFTVETKADLLRYYDEVSELVEDSNYIIEGNIKAKNSYVTDEGMVLTDYTLTVSDCMMGSKINDNEIVVTEVGGIVSYSEYAEKNNLDKEFDSAKPVSENSKVKYTFNGAPLLEVGKDYIMFVRKVENDGEIGYGLVGNYQGVFCETDDNKVERHITSENNGKMKILNKSEMKKDIKKFKGKKTDKIF